MLNRRILRIKAMQSLYGYYINKQSLKEVVKNELVSRYALDPAVHDFLDLDTFESKQSRIGDAYEKALLSGTPVDDQLDNDILNDIENHIGTYRRKLDSEYKSIRKSMLDDTRSIFDWYVKLLLLPGELSFLEKQEKEKSAKSLVAKSAKWNFNLEKNPLSLQLNTHPELLKYSIDNRINWDGEHDAIKQWYRDLIKPDELFIAYQELQDPTIEQHQEAIIEIFKKTIFKHAIPENYFTEKILHWAEDKPVIKGMVLKTIKSYEPDLDDKFEIRSLCVNQEEDFEYFERLLKETVKNDDRLDEIISQRAKNWDLSRIAILDMILLKMAITEMIEFPSIPVKVTINEFIEISKNYSTAKSKQFINGILDVLANQLTSEGVIRKSGRGLIDNK
ncbi:MAG: transcription antitermination factor NusB [Cyclobacteriaceae bacterium]|nr:transcription antitermination factor NusB [Cyclobacteriaceae bacterium]